jgi:hypothetical protein
MLLGKMKKRLLHVVRSGLDRRRLPECCLCIEPVSTKGKGRPRPFVQSRVMPSMDEGVHAP